MAATAVLGCDDRIPGAFTQVTGGPRIEERFAIDRRRDLVMGPLGLSGMRTYDNAAWDDMVRRDQWMKAIPKLRPGARVTIEIPRSQRAWMKIAHVGSNRHRLTLQACTREEGESGPSGNTAWSGGFDIDYANAPRQGRCAMLTVRVKGRTKPIRKRLAPAVTGC
jgi:hypothetical protein